MNGKINTEGKERDIILRNGFGMGVEEVKDRWIEKTEMELVSKEKGRYKA